MALDVGSVIYYSLPLVNFIKLRTGVVDPSELYERSERISDTTPARRPITEQQGVSNVPIWVDLQRRRLLFALFTFLHDLAYEF